MIPAKKVLSFVRVKEEFPDFTPHKIIKLKTKSVNLEAHIHMKMPTYVLRHTCRSTQCIIFMFTYHVHYTNNVVSSNTHIHAPSLTWA